MESFDVRSCAKSTTARSSVRALLSAQDELIIPDDIAEKERHRKQHALSGLKKTNRTDPPKSK